MNLPDNSGIIVFSIKRRRIVLSLPKGTRLAVWFFGEIARKSAWLNSPLPRLFAAWVSAQRWWIHLRPKLGNRSDRFACMQRNIIYGSLDDFIRGWVFA